MGDEDDEIDEDEDDEIDEDEEEEARPLRSAALQLAEILSPKGGRTVRHALRKNVKRSVTRKGGIASRAAALFEQVLAEVNTSRDLALFPLTLSEVLLHMREGKVVLAAATSTKENRIIAEAAKNIVTSAGRASKSTVVGMMAAPNSQGQLSLGKMVEISGFSKSHISNSRTKQTVIGPKLFSPFTDQNMVSSVTRAGVPELELV